VTDDLGFALRAHGGVNLIIGLVLLIFAIILASSARRSLYRIVRSLQTGVDDVDTEATNARRLILLYLMFGLMIGALVLAAIHLANADNWLELLAPRSAWLLRTLSNR
jgi:hypothetical protein